MKRNPQLNFLKKGRSDYGGDLLKSRKGRDSGRPIDTKLSMHFVLRSSQAVGEWSFRRPWHAQKINAILARFAQKNGVKLLSVANVGNHLHLHLKLSKRQTYKPFIRAVTSAIAMAVTGCNRWNRVKPKLKFWDRRPFSRVVHGWKSILNLENYIEINRLEGLGIQRRQAKLLIWNEQQMANSS